MSLPAQTPSFEKPGDPVNLLMRRRIRLGREAEYEALLTGATARLAGLPGHRGTGVIRPAPGERDYTLLARFDNLASAAGWELSPERAAWLARVEPLIDGEIIRILLSSRTSRKQRRMVTAQHVNSPKFVDN